MEGDLVKRLTRFGLSVNQAKVYLSIVQSASASVNTISKTTHIYRQDIYKILPKLEKMGLITKTVERPVTIEVIPVEEALNYIISTEQQKANQRIKRLKADLKALANAIEENREQSETTTQEEVKAIFLSTDRARKNKLDVSYKNARTKCDLVMDFELLRRLVPVLRKRFQALATKKVKTRLLVDTAKNNGLVKRTLEEIISSTGDFTVKLTAGKITVKPYLIIDRKEAYISSRKKTTSALPCLLRTNCKNIIHIYEESFEKAWNSPHVIKIHPKRDATERPTSNISNPQINYRA
jgi:sugar-specific transcriptional regulator TrmB